MLNEALSSHTGAGSDDSNASPGGDGFPLFTKLIFAVVFVALMVVLWKTYRMASEAYQSFEQNYTDLAALEILVDRQHREIQALQARLTANDEHCRRLREGFNELQGEIDMVSDSSELVHYGLVQLRGYILFGSLQANERRHD